MCFDETMIRELMVRGTWRFSRRIIEVKAIGVPSFPSHDAYSVPMATMRKWRQNFPKPGAASLYPYSRRTVLAQDHSCYDSLSSRIHIFHVCAP